MRLQLFLSHSGIASRRHSAELIEEGRVKVNGKIVLEPGVKVNPETDKIEFDGKPLRFEAKKYYAFHKPMNVVTTMSDEQGRKSVSDYFTRIKTRLYPVGRLDRNTTGLLIMTNDGDLANVFTHPRHEVLKRYVAMIDQPLSQGQMMKFSKGMSIEGYKLARCGIEYHGQSGKYFTYEIALHEGKNRQIRKMMEILGRQVKALHRFEHGPIKLGQLRSGEYRELTASEIQQLEALKQ